MQACGQHQSRAFACFRTRELTFVRFSGVPDLGEIDIFDIEAVNKMGFGRAVLCLYLLPQSQSAPLTKCRLLNPFRGSSSWSCNMLMKAT
jgi:hypothetical protein